MRKRTKCAKQSRKVEEGTERAESERPLIGHVVERGGSKQREKRGEI